MKRIMFGKKKENGFWMSPKKSYDFLFKNHDALYVAFGRFRFRLMKPERMI